jgi:hypothetical protein
LKFISHSRKVINIAKEFGWLPAARYTNLRDIKKFEQIGFLDIDWKNYNFKRHLDSAKSFKPIMTVARDVEDIKDLEKIIDQAFELLKYSNNVILVPKDPRLSLSLNEAIPNEFILGYSVQTKYGNTAIEPKYFRRPTHLLGGRPEIQRKIAELIPVISIDCNRFTFDAVFGDYFDGEIFRPHPTGGYERCIIDSITNINLIWEDYNS